MRDQCKPISPAVGCDRIRKEACYRMRGAKVMSPENYSYVSGIFISSDAQRNEVE